MDEERNVRKEIKDVIELTDFEMRGNLAICVSVSSPSTINPEANSTLDLEDISNKTLKISSKCGLEIMISFNELKTFQEGQLLAHNKPGKNKRQSIFIVI
jgi:hypothetical protein